MKPLVALSVLIALSACGSSDTVTEVTPSSPKGRVSGRVLNSQGQPLSEVEVLLSGKDVKARTDAAGMFAIDRITGGSTVGLFFSRTGYAPAWTSATIPGATGNFPLNDGEAFVGPLGLLANNGELTVHVVGYDGALVKDLTGSLVVTPGFLDFGDGSGGYGRSEITAAATGTSGVLKFTGIPKVEEMARLKGQNVTARYSLYIPPVYDANGLVYAGKTATYTAEALLTEPWTRTLVLPPPGAEMEIAIVASNVANLLGPSSARQNLVPGNGSIYIVFNQRISSSVFVEIRDDHEKKSESQTIPVGLPEVNSVGNQLQITPKGELGVGQKYVLTVQVAARDNPEAHAFRASASFFGGDPNNPALPNPPTLKFIDANDDFRLNPSETLQFDFASYIGRGDTAGFKVPVYFRRTDLGGAPDQADAPGEKDSTGKTSGLPICLSMHENLPAYGGATTGYARHAAPTTAGALGLPEIDDVTKLEVTFAFSEASKCGGPILSLWGEPLLTDVTVVGIERVPPPAP